MAGFAIHQSPPINSARVEPRVSASAHACVYGGPSGEQSIPGSLTASRVFRLDELSSRYFREKHQIAAAADAQTATIERSLWVDVAAAAWGASLVAIAGPAIGERLQTFAHFASCEDGQDGEPEHAVDAAEHKWPLWNILSNRLTRVRDSVRMALRRTSRGLHDTIAGRSLSSSKAEQITTVPPSASSTVATGRRGARDALTVHGRPGRPLLILIRPAPFRDEVRWRRLRPAESERSVADR